jgi:3-hydroxyacyl-CoA dehydrogenase
MKASEIVARLESSDATVKAVVRLYEQNGKKRKSILTATD